jgi:hypothetical protein
MTRYAMGSSSSTDMSIGVAPVCVHSSPRAFILIAGRRIYAWLSEIQR